MEPPSFLGFSSKKDRLRNLLNSNEHSDCAFVFEMENNVIRAHKLILMCSSPVFEKMLYGKMSSDTITIADIACDDFKEMLEFVYTDEVEIKSVPHAWSLLYIAHKYLLNDLIEICINYVIKNLTLNNLVLSYEYAELYNIDEVQKTCMEVMTNFYGGLFQRTPDSYHMKSSTLLALLNQPMINVDNCELVNGILQWTENELSVQNVAKNPENALNLLKAWGLLKFLIDVDLDSILTNKQFFQSILNHVRGEITMKSSIPLKVYSRKHWCTFCKSRQTYKIANRVQLREGDNLPSTISVNRKSMVFGLVVMSLDDNLGGISNQYRGSVSVQICDNSNLLMESTYQKLFTYETEIYVPLREPVILESDRNYIIKIGYNGGNENGGFNSVLFHYMSNKLVDEKKKTIFTFNEMGSVVKGLSYYPA